MTFARLRLVLAAALFVAWLGWLAVAVRQKGTVQLVSRAQLTAATHLVVAEVRSAPDGRPDPKVTVRQVLRGPANDAPAGDVEVANLPKAATPLPVNDTRTPAAGEYLLPLVKIGSGWRVAGLPPSPGYAGDPDPARPLIYPWADDVKAQLRAVGVLQ
jgi:hypothetical protein